ncbi:MAG: HPr kinase/phosphorylase [Rhodospirillales bacterium]
MKDQKVIQVSALLLASRKPSKLKIMAQFHATAIAIVNAGVLIRGPSGSGKSDLALRLIDGGAALISDDRVNIEVTGSTLYLSAPTAIRNLIEVRGLGAISISAVQNIPLCLIVNLKPSAEIDRMPEAKSEPINGITIPVIDINPFEISATSKIRIALSIQKESATLIE